jgi:hypothetical protein
MLTDELRATATEVLAHLPCSLEMPAGTGKTQLVAATATITAELGHRTLVLTHTHAGVDAIRRRLRKFGVPKQAVHVDTITGWAFDLVRSYPNLAGVTVPAVPDWTKSSEYVAGAIKVAQSRAIKDMHAASFEYFIVDEYQDCGVQQHDLMVAIADAIPRACVLGDRLQGIFGFRGQPLVDWDNHVFGHFPLYSMQYAAWRWHDCNVPLGEWLLAIRPTLLQGDPIDFSTVRVPGLNWVQSYNGVVSNQGLRQWPSDSSILILGQWKEDADDHGKDLLGVFGVMEDLRGEFMHKFLAAVEASQPEQRPVVLARFAKCCFVGLAGIDTPLMDKLGRGQAVSSLKRDGIGPVQAALDALLPAPSLLGVSMAMSAIAKTPGLRLYKREAWNDCIKALETCEAGEVVSATDALGRIRDSLRHSGRRPSNRVVSRTVLVKGLEYDHVVIGNADVVADCRNLYVALTRARYSVTIISSTPVIWRPAVRK